MNRLKLEEKLKRYIRADGRSQAAVARKLGYTPDTFNKWVRGVNRMPDGVIADFCTLLTLTPVDHAELLNLAGYAVPETLLQRRERGQTHGDARPVAGLVFATHITPEGRAIDPGTTFAPNVADLYAVFRADSTIPGTTVSVEDPAPDAYYAYLRINDEPTISTLGWRR
ncbi:MAG: helix-turn-helix transcriptional regulator, partial [Caldilineaceae bacterium]|nr:helix-turn-helix transcriptional regulator [Caldilineaceae bacterium]